MLSSLPYEIPVAIINKAQKSPPLKIAVCGAGHKSALKAVQKCHELSLIAPLLVGDRDKISLFAKEIGFDISEFPIIHAKSEVEIAEKAVSEVAQNHAEALLKGNIHTNILLKAVLAPEANLRGSRRMSHVFYMTVPRSNQRLVITDAVVNVLPNAMTLSDIVNNAIDFVQVIDSVKPKVALLSGTEAPIKSMPSSMLMHEIAQSFEKHPDAIIQGPLAFDIAISQKAAEIKGTLGEVPGNPDILVVPNLEAGNILFKSMVYFMSANSAGLILGAKVPIILTSRSDPKEAKVTSVALAGIYRANNHRIP